MNPPTKFQLMRANRAKQIQPSDPSAPPKHYRTLHIEVLDLTVRSQNVLKAENVYTLGDLYDHDNLMKTPNMGRKSMAEIREKLAAKGLPALA